MKDDRFLWSKQWQIKRLNILRRDEYTDQYLLKTSGRMVNADVVHHILPKEEFPQYALCDWNLISLSANTHNRIIHNCRSGKLTNEGRKLMFETAIINGIKLREKVMVIGLPGSGKTTLVRTLLGEDAIAYDLDAIAAAFRLRGEHEETHEGSRRLANNLFKAFAMRGSEFASRLYIIRSAPTLDEISTVRPDRVILCTAHYPIRNRADFVQFDISDMERRIKDVRQWCEKNLVDLEEYPPPNG